MRLAGLLVLAVVGLDACGGQTILPVKEEKKCEVQVVSLTVIASPNINPTTEGEARPVQMRIYQLKDDVKLQSATFDDIWKKDDKTLGQDIIKRDDVFIYPNTRTDVKFDRDPAAQFIVGAGLFRNAKGKSWYMSFELPVPPGKGDCRTPPSEDCPDGKCGFDPNPKFSLWVDQAHVDDGADHLSDVTDNKRIRLVQLSKPVPAPPPAASASAGDKQ